MKRRNDPLQGIFFDHLQSVNYAEMQAGTTKATRPASHMIRDVFPGSGRIQRPRHSQNDEADVRYIIEPGSIVHPNFDDTIDQVTL